MDSLNHNGVYVLEPPELPALEITVRGILMTLTPLQSEMAVAWVRKLGTPYVEDKTFTGNFMADFSKALGANPALRVDEIDFAPVQAYVETERARKEAMTKEEKKADQEARKAAREALKEKYGFAIVDGERMELGQYQTEPSGIFMGRGEHPLRGRWKQGATYGDITLNLSPGTLRPEGDWQEVIWAPDCMWIAKWTDELTKKTKYLWLHDSTPVKQEREEAKFDKALSIDSKMEEIRAHIHEGLQSDNPKQRAVAAACYLIDSLSLRVGDEKDPEEADTVGATTLRAEHLDFKTGSVVFDFLGKDSVHWHKELDVPEDIYTVLQELHAAAGERLASFQSRKGKSTRGDPKKIAQLFPTIRSTHVNRFLSEVVPGLTAKMFRTHHASVTIREELKQSKVKKTDADFIKKAAFRRANLEVARVMNHTKQAPKGWANSEARYRDRIKTASTRVEKAKKALASVRAKQRDLSKKEELLVKKKQELVTKQKVVMEQNWESVKILREKRDKAKVTWDNARDRKRKTRGSKRKATTTKKERLEDAQQSIERTKARLDANEAALSKVREKYQKSKDTMEKTQVELLALKEKVAARQEKGKQSIEAANERVKSAELAKEKIEVDLALAKASRTWNLGTSLKSYIHPKIVYMWCQKVDYDWRKVYSSILQRKFSWVEQDQ